MCGGIRAVFVPLKRTVSCGSKQRAHLFVEAEKLAVAYPTVQHTVDVDVVGLQVEAEIPMKRKRLKQQKTVGGSPGKLYKKQEIVKQA